MSTLVALGCSALALLMGAGAAFAQSGPQLHMQELFPIDRQVTKDPDCLEDWSPPMARDPAPADTVKPVTQQPWPATPPSASQETAQKQASIQNPFHPLELQTIKPPNFLHPAAPQPWPGPPSNHNNSLGPIAPKAEPILAKPEGPAPPQKQAQLPTAQSAMMVRSTTDPNAKPEPLQSYRTTGWPENIIPPETRYAHLGVDIEYPERLVSLSRLGGLKHLPPPEYDKPYEGKLTITRVESTAEVKRVCAIDKETLACAKVRRADCEIIMAEDDVIKRNGHIPIVVFRHELGHCNNWPSDHPNARGFP